MRLAAFRPLALALAIFAVPAAAGAQDVGLELGTQAPASAAVETLDGKAADLSQYIGKTPVVMQFWATSCGNCAELEPHMKAMHAKYGQQVKFAMIAVSVNQTAARAKLFAEKHALPGDQYFDRKGNASGAFDAPATSYVVILDRAGKVVYTGLGGKQKLESALQKAIAAK